MHLIAKNELPVFASRRADQAGWIEKSCGAIAMWFPVSEIFHIFYGSAQCGPQYQSIFACL
jgi:hypothetical protein